MSLFLVTGGAGFIGSNLVEKLLHEGEDVRVLDNLDTGEKDNLAESLKKIDFLKGDIRDSNTVMKAAKGVDYILHIAAQRSVPRSIDDPLNTNEVNVQGTLNILWWAKELGVKRVTFASSSSVYGDSPTVPLKESQASLPLSPYAVSKLVGEYYCKVFYEIYGLETVSLRYFNVFGPRQDPYSQYANVVPLFIKAGLDGRQVEVHWDGQQSRDFTYIGDTVNATLLATKAPGVAGMVFNVGCGKEYSILTLLKSIERIIGRPIHYIHTEARKGDVRRTLADISLAERLLGFKVAMGFEKGLEKTIEWFKKHRVGDKR
ncbi:MAG: SDR family oxidoreductase [Candidatus Brocadiaceae bacterium]|nr:SDR family oxidoreductase [Candidatus Brocadiaceae bacterium]